MPQPFDPEPRPGNSTIGGRGAALEPDWQLGDPSGEGGQVPIPWPTGPCNNRFPLIPQMLDDWGTLCSSEKTGHSCQSFPDRPVSVILRIHRFNDASLLFWWTTTGLMEKPLAMPIGG
jgi:hypothetical protein